LDKKIFEDEIRLEMEDVPAYVPLSQVVFQILKKAILAGSLKPGQLLSENKIANKLSVSRTPVREALRTLELENLVTPIPGRKIIVSIPTIDDIEEIYDIRLIIEIEALRNIVLSAESESVIGKLENHIKDSEIFLKEQDLTALSKINTEFHLTIISALENKRLQKFIDTLHETISRFRTYSLMDMKWAERGVHEHKEIVKLLKDGESEDATDVLRKHLETAKIILIDMFKVENSK
jgi:DNA-binding GntR family transcriptional regulator